MITTLLKGQNMNHNFGFVGAIITLISYISSKILSLFSTLFMFRIELETLQMISLSITIVVGCLTILWYIGNMVIKRKEFWRSIKDLFK